MASRRVGFKSAGMLLMLGVWSWSAVHQASLVLMFGLI